MFDLVGGWLQDRRAAQAARAALREHQCPTCRQTFTGSAGVPTLGRPACSTGCAQAYNESVAW